MNKTSALRAAAQLLLAMMVGLVLVSCTPSQVQEPTAVSSEYAIRTSELDTRDYRYLELPNRMRVLLVSDPETDKAAASLAVRAGSGNNPKTRQGLAHFLEHMLFLGTDKYPDPGGYIEFINAHGGSHNAYTSIDHTNYFFDIDPTALEQALDRFADFFVSPNMDAAYVDREMNAVDSEYNMGLKDDGRREFDVYSEIISPDHPLSMLAVGNLETLSGGESVIRDDLLAFYESHYSANLMSLVVVGQDSLDGLEAMVRSRFEAVKDRNLEEMDTAPAMFETGTLPQALYIEPEKDLRDLTLLFPVPSAKDAYSKKPMEFIGNLLGHEGKGSLLSVLKARGWAEGLGAGSGLDFYGQDAFQISVDLTPEGLNHRDEIIALAFAAIDLVRQQGVEQWRFDEQAKLSELSFRFKEKGSPTGTAIGAANALWEYSPAEVMHGAYDFAEFDASLIDSYLALLRPDNLLITVKHKGVETDRVSRWYQVPYRIESLDPATLQTDAPADLIASLSLPSANDFVPDEVAVKAFSEEASVPALVVDEPGFRQWYLQDAAFPAPRAAVFFRVSSAAARDEALDQAFAELYVRLVRDALAEYAYPAALAGLGYDISATGRGVGVNLSGYDERQSVLLERVLDRMNLVRFDPARFASLKRDLIRDWANASKDRPFSQLMRLSAPALAARNWTAPELIAALQDKTDLDLAEWLNSFYADTSIDVLVHGNHTLDDASALGQQIKASLATASSSGIPAIEIVDLAEGSRAALELEIDHPDSSVVYYVQAPASSDRDRALMQLSAQIIETDFFNSLRTEQQLGYVVFAGAYPLYRVPGIGFVVQSANTSADGVLAAIEAFIGEQHQAAASMDEPSFDRYRLTMINLLREAPKSQAERAQRLWSDLQLDVQTFDDADRLARILEGVTLEEWRAWFRDYVTGTNRAALVFYTEGGANPGDGSRLSDYAPLSLDAVRAIEERFRFDG